MGTDAPRFQSLIQALTTLAGATRDKARLRREALALIKTAFLEERERIKCGIEDKSLSGLAAAQALSVLQDAFIRIICDFAVRYVYRPRDAAKAERMSVVATGGYGRGELAPGSDIDLLFLRPVKKTARGDSIIAFILYMLWDMGLKVGHATRSLGECVRLAKQDITIRTALLEARYVWGDRKFYSELRRKFWREVATGNGQDFVEAKLAERHARHMHQGESRYLVEPNVKEGKGGLRDLQTLYWIGKYLYHVDDAADLVQHNVFNQDEYETFQKARSFLWDVRVRLHTLVGRAEERLSFDIQPELTACMGFTDETPRRAVEKFMKAYFLVAKDVGDLTRIFCAALEEQNKKHKPSLARLLPGFLKPRTGGEAFFVENGRLNAAGDAFETDPVNILRIFQIADAKDVDIHPQALRTLTRSLDLITDALRADRAANRLFLDTLASRHYPERALRWMNEAGVLGRFIPEFGHAVGLMQFNMYHHYTVDEHLLRTVGNVAAIERGEHKSDNPLSSEIIKRLKSRETLYVAALLHDIAKGMGGNHSQVGAQIALTLCPRLGLGEEDTEAVSWLVQHHLLMSEVSQRRDISDPQTVRDFVRIVQSPELLRLLVILTVADIRAVGPGVWNGWKGELLRELYHQAESMMTGGDQVPARAKRVESAKAALAARLEDMTPQMRETLLNKHYNNYWLAFDIATHERHARLLAKATADNDLLALDAESDTFRAVTQIIVYTPDHPGLFSQLAGAIAVSGGSIVDAKAFTTTDGFGLDIFSVQNMAGEAFDDAARLARLRRTIERTLTGEFRPRAAIAARAGQRRTSAFRIKPVVHFDNEASRLATVVEVECLDRPGLLYDVTKAITESGLSISSSMVSTYGERAIDVFYVRDGFGHKITHENRIKAVRARLMAALAPAGLEAAAASGA
jgi:[protein-PII] uridylyltransferase